jgi:acetyl-CoA carboxylase biotin carboxyl carrier protein
MTIEEIKDLIRVVQETGIAELEVHRGDNSVRIANTSAARQELSLPAMIPVSVAPATQIPVSNATALPPTAASPAAAPEQELPSEESRDVVVKSPIVGTYFDSAAPGAPPFVKVGDQIHPKQVLCIIESMKLMNEIEAETAGTIIAKLVENGRPVEYGESLFTIRPSQA